ncbi:hypothetical protein GGI18_003889 [Coemansia linderi]|uniref:Uncharacterized protein n=1 Tax=Coemansia linderi TaxID=2663919 RepID=A0ACC1KAT4_9FUNG|nr:hypothetical protein GGI18_003889 [Coemansia linderi]
MSSTDSDGGIPLSVRVAGLPSGKRNGGGGNDSSSDSDNVPLSIRSKRQLSSADSGTESDQPLSGRVKAPRKKAIANGSAPGPAPKRTKKALAPKETKRPRTAASSICRVFCHA